MKQTQNIKLKQSNGGKAALYTALTTTVLSLVAASFPQEATFVTNVGQDALEIATLVLAGASTAVWVLVAAQLTLKYGPTVVNFIKKSIHNMKNKHNNKTNVYQHEDIQDKPQTKKSPAHLKQDLAKLTQQEPEKPTKTKQKANDNTALLLQAQKQRD